MKPKQGFESRLNDPFFSDTRKGDDYDRHKYHTGDTGDFFLSPEIEPQARNAGHA
jgi:hypothetical protein